MQVLYTAVATAVGGRQGSVRSDDGVINAPLRESSVTARVGIGREADGYFRLTVALEVSAPGRDRAEVEAIARVAHAEVCPYSRATRGNIDVTVTVA